MNCFSLGNLVSLNVCFIRFEFFIVVGSYREVFEKYVENLFSFKVEEVRRLLDSLSFGEFLFNLILFGYELGYILFEGIV